MHMAVEVLALEEGTACHANMLAVLMLLMLSSGDVYSPDVSSPEASPMTLDVDFHNS